MAWRAARLDDIGSDLTSEWWSTWAREADFGGGWHSVGTALRITGFGVNVSDADAGRELVVPHSETEFGGQEELYVMLSGRARFTVAGETVELGPRELLLVSHEEDRDAVALEDGTAVLCIGGTPGKPYSPD
jgi:hypothetical protein